MTAIWLAIPLGLLIVLLAAGALYRAARRRMSAQRDLSEMLQYLQAIGETPEHGPRHDQIPGRRSN